MQSLICTRWRAICQESIKGFVAHCGKTSDVMAGNLTCAIHGVKVSRVRPPTLICNFDFDKGLKVCFGLSGASTVPDCYWILFSPLYYRIDKRKAPHVFEQRLSARGHEHTLTTSILQHASKKHQARSTKVRPLANTLKTA